MIIGISTSFLYTKVGSFKLNDQLQLVVSREGFLGCGETLRITKSQLLVFDRELIYDSNRCLRGIKNIKILKADKNEIELLIYHDGKMDSENPYSYQIENNNRW